MIKKCSLAVIGKVSAPASRIQVPNKQRKRAESHIFDHREQLMVMWHKAVNGENPGKLGDVC
ncbi:MAG: hypothetical protein GBQ79_08200 [Halomonas sp.]|nr:hypothetical protein [Halomonas sp.]